MLVTTDQHDADQIYRLSSAAPSLQETGGSCRQDLTGSHMGSSLCGPLVVFSVLWGLTACQVCVKPRLPVHSWSTDCGPCTAFSVGCHSGPQGQQSLHTPSQTPSYFSESLLTPLVSLQQASPLPLRQEPTNSSLIRHRGDSLASGFWLLSAVQKQHSSL